MGPSITDLLSGPQERPPFLTPEEERAREEQIRQSRMEGIANMMARDTTETVRRDLRGMVPQASADSIMSVLGIPARKVLQEAAGGGGAFRPYNQQISLDRRGAAETQQTRVNGRAAAYTETNLDDFMAQVFSHELAHEKTRPLDPNALGVVNMVANSEGRPGFEERELTPNMMSFLSLWQDRATALSPEDRERLIVERAGERGLDLYIDHYTEEVLGQGEPTPQSRNLYKDEATKWFLSQNIDRLSDLNEVVANALDRGFYLARRADPNDPSKIRDLLAQVDEDLPGTREAFNFWMRGFAAMEDDDGS